MIKYILYSLFLVFTAAKALSQQTKEISWEYNYKHFGIKNGLPSSETYQVYQDKSGLLWVLTDRGIVRYDGYEFHTYTMESGLADNVNFRVVEDSQGGVWFVGYNGLLSVFRDGKMQPYPYNHLIRKKLDTAQNPIISMHVNEDLSIVYSSFKSGIFTISKNGRLKELPFRSLNGASFWQFGNDFLPHSALHRVNGPVNTYLIRNNRKIVIGKLFFTITVRAKEHKKQYFALANHKAYMNGGKQFELIPGTTAAIGLDTDEEFVYIGYYKGGVKKFRFDRRTRKLILAGHYLKGFSVTSACRDLNGTLWFTTLEKGMFAIHDEAIRQLSINGKRFNGEVRFINGNKDKVVLTHYVGKWQQLYPPYLCKDAGKMLEKYNLLPFGNGFAFKKGIVDWSDWPEVDDSYPVNPVYQTGKSLVGNTKEDTTRVMEIRPVNTILRVLAHTGGDDKLSSAFHWYYITANNQLFEVYNQGVFVLEIQHKKFGDKPRPVLKKRIHLMKYNPVWGLIACSNSEGIFTIDTHTGKAREFASDLGLGKQILTFFFDEKDQLWVSTRKGIFLLVRKHGKMSVNSFLDNSLLSSSEITDLYAYNQVVYLGTKVGVQKIEWQKVKKGLSGFPLEVFSARGFTSNKQLVRSKVYPAKTDLIKISLFSKKLDKPVEYRYRFAADETWVKSNKGEIILNHPTNGDFNLEVACLNENGKWSASKILYSFSVEKVLFLRWYFLLLYAVLLIVLFYMILKLSIQSVNKKNYMLNRMMELERMALSAQMNPHFIFNSLNSIHSFLLYEENENAEKYLLRFAKLIRQTLSNSRATYITVEEEYETLKNYILLENMRFKNGFTFRIECDFNQMPLNPCIPPMLIQPYVENAIIHGLPKRTQGAELLIRFYKEGDRLKVMIRDNGIGYKESQRNKRDTGHKSYGTQITEERMKSLQERNREGFSVEVSDADESNPEFPGTKVILTIPI
ncbi:histidine kinase [Fluviicola sp.]|uniref:sensor histidine kinase n=1 Tax=Fluviicola sp. TaxID=1917219 RepID=UPI0031D07D99